MQTISARRIAMAEKKEFTDKKTKRVKVEEMPQPERELTAEEQKKIKGGDWLMQPAGHARPSK